MRLYTILLITIFSTNAIQGQIFGRIMDRAKDKIEDRIEDKIVEKISEEIARAAYKPVDKAIDDMFKERYRQDSLNGNTDMDYDGFMKAFLTPVELPDTYNFDMSLYVETKDYDGDKQNMILHLTKTGNYLGISQPEEQSMMVLDTEHEIMALYTDSDGQKQVQAFPSMLSMAMQMVDSDQAMMDNSITIEKTGKTKKIEGYQCEEWKVEDEQTESKIYVAENFPIGWKESFGNLLKEVSPTSRRDKMPEGMCLKSETKTVKKNKKTTYEVKKIDENTFTINNDEYEKVNYQAADN